MPDLGVPRAKSAVIKKPHHSVTHPGAPPIDPYTACTPAASLRLTANTAMLPAANCFTSVVAGPKIGPSPSIVHASSRTSAESALHMSLPEPVRMVSVPLPPSIRSRPSPPERLSLPASPRSTSSPASPVILSLPVPPATESASFPPDRTSFPEPPSRVSAPVPPEMVSLPAPPESSSV